MWLPELCRKMSVGQVRPGELMPQLVGVPLPKESHRPIGATGLVGKWFGCKSGTKQFPLAYGHQSMESPDIELNVFLANWLDFKTYK